MESLSSKEAANFMLDRRDRRRPPPAIMASSPSERMVMITMRIFREGFPTAVDLH
jgi:hypothetical protein